MNLLEIFEELLPIEPPFFVDFISKDEENLEVTIHLGIEKSYRPHSDCGTIRQYYNRKWEHLNIFQYRCFIKCKLPIYDNLKTGKTEALQVEFSRAHARFTLLYEQEVLRLLKLHQCQKKVAKQLKINTQRAGKGADVIENFFHNNANPAIITGISIDMSPAFISGCKTYFPWVKPTFDKWHVYKLLGKHLYDLLKQHPDKYEQFDTLWNLLGEFYNRTSYQKAQTQLMFIAFQNPSVVISTE